VDIDIDLAVFDLTGTTVEDRGEIEASFEAALDVAGVKLDPGAFDSVRGMSKREALSAMLDGDAPRVESAYRRFLEELGGRFESEGAHLRPGVAETFSRLRSRGVKLAINTGLDRSIVEILNYALPELDLEAVVCGDDVARGRPWPYLIFHAMEKTGVPSVHRVLVVGDTVKDLEAGANAGARYNVGVLGGAHDRSRLEKAPHTHLLSSVAELESIFS
jgi:phosphonatase-like hydrolase